MRASFIICLLGTQIKKCDKCKKRKVQFSFTWLQSEVEEKSNKRFSLKVKLTRIREYWMIAGMINKSHPCAQRKLFQFRYCLVVLYGALMIQCVFIDRTMPEIGLRSTSKPRKKNERGKKIDEKMLLDYLLWNYNSIKSTAGAIFHGYGANARYYNRHIRIRWNSLKIIVVWIACRLHTVWHGVRGSIQWAA